MICAFWSKIKIEKTCIIIEKFAGIDWNKLSLVIASPRAIARVLEGWGSGSWVERKGINGSNSSSFINKMTSTKYSKKRKEWKRQIEL